MTNQETNARLNLFPRAEPVIRAKLDFRFSPCAAFLE
jgi:hypothetical protein